MLLPYSIASNFPLATFCQFGQTRKPAIPLFSTIPAKQRFFAEVAEVVPSEDGHFCELLFPVQGLPLAAGAQAGALQVCRVRPVRLSAAVPEVPRGGLAAGGGAEGGRAKGGCNQ